MAVSDRIAVMNQGSVVQIGTAEDLYHRPASPFVAQFVGRVNLVAGRVTAIEGDSARIDVLGSTVTLRSLRVLAPGEVVQVVLRPEAIELVRNHGAAGPPLATVVSRTFLGEKIEYRVRCGDETLQVVRHNAGPGVDIEDGTTVALRFAENPVAVLPGSAA
jgi:ABC-type Fe3+/spermidine/putrescine transport system ATPase subunit